MCACMALILLQSEQLGAGLRPTSAGILCTLLLRIGVIGFQTFWLITYTVRLQGLYKRMGFKTLIIGLLGF